MAFYTIISIYLLLIFIYFSTLVVTYNDGVSHCVESMKKYCKCEKEELSAHVCIKEAIRNWLDSNLPDGYVKEYYHTFDGNINTDYIVAPDVFCQNYPFDKREKCKVEMLEFKESPEDAVKHALYSTTYPATLDDPDRNFFRFSYMIHIIFSFGINPGAILEPQDYCKAKSYPQSYEVNSTPLER